MIERTESEIAEAYEKERTALAAAKAEIARLQELRPRLLKTETVDEIIELDDEIRRETIAAEIAAARMAPLKIELEMVQHERAKWSGVEMPSAGELDGSRLRGELFERLAAHGRASCITACCGSRILLTFATYFCSSVDGGLYCALYRSDSRARRALASSARHREGNDRVRVSL